MSKLKVKKEPAFSFIIEELLNSKLADQVIVKPIFGSHAVYLGDKIYFILRHKAEKETARDNGLWIAFASEPTQDLTPEFPALRKIELFQKRSQKGFSDWLNLPESSPDFEESAYHLIKLILKNDPRFGKLPKKKSIVPKKNPQPSRKKKSP